MAPGVGAVCVTLSMKSIEFAARFAEPTGAGATTAARAKPMSACPDPDCPVERALGVLDGKWTVLVIRELMSGTRRFTELRRSLAGVSPKTLTDRLRALEQRGLVERRSFAEIPPRVEYSLTADGRTLEPVIAALGAWGSRLGPAGAQPRPRARRISASRAASGASASSGS